MTGQAGATESTFAGGEHVGRASSRSSWGTSIAAFLVGLALSAVVAPLPVLAGHTLGAGDCWRPGTPLTCRVTWYSGDRHSITLRVINQLSDSTLWNAAATGCQNWNQSTGPQFCYTSAHTNDSWVYFKRNDSIGAPNGLTVNCDSSGYCSSVAQAMNIKWSEIYEPIKNKNFPSLLVPIAAHELGHALGMAHHGTAGSNVALMTQGTTRTFPNSIDIGPLPACSTNPVGSNGTGGVRCIYNATY